MTYYVEKGDATCTDRPATPDARAQGAASGQAPKSDTYTFTTAGTYYFWAVYRGDATTTTAATALRPEIVVVDPNTPDDRDPGQEQDADDRRTSPTTATSAIGTVAYDTADARPARPATPAAP